jgi:prolyl-tRNA synthetase
LTKNNVAVLYDDRQNQAGAKFADAELMGIPYRLVVSAKTLAENQVELKARNSSKISMLSLGDDVIKILSK